MAITPPPSEKLSAFTSDAELGQLLRTRRTELGISQYDLADMSGVPQPNLSRIERGAATATLETYIRLCAPLGIDLFAGIRS